MLLYSLQQTNNCGQTNNCTWTRIHTEIPSSQCSELRIKSDVYSVGTITLDSEV